MIRAVVPALALLLYGGVTTPARAEPPPALALATPPSLALATPPSLAAPAPSALLAIRPQLSHEARPKKKTWRLIITPAGGFFKNVLRFTYEVPTGPNELTSRTKELVDTGAGGAFVSTFISGKWAITNVTFLIPNVNRSRVLGSTFYLSYRHPLNTWLDLFGGLGLVIMDIDGHYQDFEDTITKSGVSATARLDDIWVRNTVFAPFPRLGVRFNLPIQHWFVAPWVSYLYEAFEIDFRSTGGRVYIPAPIDDTKKIPSLRSKHWKQYHSALVGLDLRLDFHYALQLRARIHYDLNHDKLSIRLLGTAFFSRKVPIGMAVQFAYVEGIVHDNTYAFVGPSFLF
ncbi:MAG: hypothetical protein KAI47_09330 [Deltaproteobacteria bacterium]|nr:hypothetical protein [Deltaproteobacteria bacterium]